MQYSDIVNALGSLLILPPGDPNYTIILPSVINDAEGRIYKDMNFLAVRETDTSRTFATGNREILTPTLMIEVEQVGFVSVDPTTAIQTTTFLDFASLDFINTIWPMQSFTGLMQYWANKDNATIVVAGTPNLNYAASIVGKVRPAPLSATNISTYISINHPELLIAACMVFSAGYQRDFGAQNMDPKMALSWEGVYQSRLTSSKAEEARRMGQGRN